MKIFNEKESVLIMLIKEASYIEDIPVVEGSKDYPNENVFGDFPFLLEHYTKNYFPVNLAPYKEIEALYVSLIGDIIFDINPLNFKKLVFCNYGSVGYPKNIVESTLLEDFIYYIRDMDMKDKVLDPNVKNILKGDNING